MSLLQHAVPRPLPHLSEYMTSGPFAVGPREPLGNARRLMDKYELRHLPVLSEGKLIGIVSDRDMNLVQTLAHAPPESITIEDAMTPDPYAPSPDTPLVDVVRMMVERKIGSAVVVDDGQIVGIFTASDAMRALIDLLSHHGHGVFQGLATGPFVSSATTVATASPPQPQTPTSPSPSRSPRQQRRRASR